MKNSSSRRLLLKSALFGASFSIPGVSLALYTPFSRAISGNIEGVFNSDEQIRQLGLAYCEIVPTETDVEFLIQLILKASKSIPLGSLIPKEFCGGDTVTVNGWILSRTEARHYALYYLIVE